ncbi:hypothetical protein KNE206_32110 [Kitasatospora sp. NE20-6]
MDFFREGGNRLAASTGACEAPGSPGGVNDTDAEGGAVRPSGRRPWKGGARGEPPAPIAGPAGARTRRRGAAIRSRAHGPGCKTGIMTLDRRSLGLPVFSEPAAELPLPAQSGGRRPLPVEQGAAFREPPGEDVAVPVPVRRPLAVDGLTFSDPDRPI